MHRFSPPRASEVIQWPRDTARREELARRGVPCLLVVAEGAPVPAVGRGEDWVRATADEREVASRLAQLTVVGRRPDALVPPILPASLAGPGRRVADLLARAPGGLVTRDAIEAAAEPDGVTPTIAEVRTAMEQVGWAVDPVPAVGYVLTRSTSR